MIEESIVYKEGKISFWEKGSGRAIIMLHGFLENKDMWTEFATKLSKRYRVISIDLPGHGQSDCFGYVHSMELMAECVHAVIKHLKLRKLFLVGHSMGGYVSLAYAEAFPAYVKGICLFHSTAAADSEERKQNREKALDLVKRNHKSFINQTVPLWFAKDTRSVFKKEIQEIKESALKMPVQGIVAAIEGMKNRIDREMILKFSNFYLFYMIGKKDETIPFAQVKKQTTIPNDCEYLILENVGHMGFLEAKEQTLKAIKKFATKVFRHD
jgi:pimeloyl-ACP methyl ester carboxylesterase